jgi:hypothetical protein
VTDYPCEQTGYTESIRGPVKGTEMPEVCWYIADLMTYDMNMMMVTNERV